MYQLNSIISTVNYTPQDPQAEDDVPVTVSVATPSTPISQVRLHCSVHRGASKTLAMTLQGSSYKGTIPKQAEGAVVEFYISVMDTTGTVSESSEFSYSVGGGVELPDLEIPGFPWESILIGLAFGLVTLYFLARKRSMPSIPISMRWVAH